MDVIALHQAGFATAVAPLGTALTEFQLHELWRLTPEPLLCFDGDAAGQRAAARAMRRALPLLRPGHSLRFVSLPAGEDPDSVIRQARAGYFRPDPRRGAAALDRALGERAWREPGRHAGAPRRSRAPPDGPNRPHRRPDGPGRVSTICARPALRSGTTGPPGRSAFASRSGRASCATGRSLHPAPEDEYSGKIYSA